MAVRRLSVPALVLAASVLVGVAVTVRPLAAIGAVAGVTAIVLVAAYPIQCLVIYVASRPLADMLVFLPIGHFSLGQVWGVGLLALIGRVLLDHRFTPPARALAAPLIISSVLFNVALLHGTAAAAALPSVKLLTWLLLVVAIEQIARAYPALSMRGGALFGVLALCSVGVAVATNRYGAAFYGGTQFGSSLWFHSSSIAGYNQDPHGLAVLAVFAIPLVLLSAMAGGGPWTVVLASTLAGAAVMSLVRTGLVALVALIVGLGYIALRTLRTRLTRFAMLSLAGGVIAFWVELPAIHSRFADLGAGSGQTASTPGSGRLRFWDAIWSAYIHDPVALLVGRGFGASKSVIFAATNQDVWPHNDLLEFFATGGTILVITYVILFFWIAAPSISILRSRSRRTISYAIAGVTAAATVSFLATSLLDGALFYEDPAIPFAILLGICRASSVFVDDGLSGVPGGGAGQTMPGVER